MNGVMQAVLDALMAVGQEIGRYMSTFTGHDLWSLLIGAFAATLFELPIINRFKRH